MTQQVSFGQEQTWFLQQLVPASAFHHVAVKARLRGPLDTDALRRSVRAVHRRHDALRTVLRFRGDALVQEVVDGRELAIAEQDLAMAPAARRAQILRDAQDEELRRPFDLENGPLVRFHLSRLDSRGHELLVVLHRLVADEPSLAVIQRELLACYEAFAVGGEPSLPDVPLQFPDHAAWQRGLLQGGGARPLVEHWKETLAALPDPVELPFGKRRGAEPSTAGAEVDLPLRPRVWDALGDLAEQEATTLAAVARAGLAGFLHRFARRQDVVLGTPVSGRHRPGAEDAVGPFADVLPLRVRVPGSPTWRDLLRLVGEAEASARAHADVPLRLLAELLRPERHLNMAPLVQVVVSPRPPAESLTAAGVTFAFSPLDSGEALYDLELRLEETAGGPRAALRYKRELYEPDAAEELARRLALLLEQMASSPDERFSNLSILPEDEREQVVYEWNQTRTDYPAERTIHSLFEECADRSPDAPALKWEQFELTYGQLERQANRVARYLRRLGVGTETRVGIYYGYSAEWVIAALATLKAGGAYVPLDPSYPAGRLTTMCEDSEVSVLLVQQGLEGSAELPVPRRVVLSAEVEAIEQESDARLPESAAPDALAYVMFTSGSTGRPKAIGSTHRNVIRTVCNTNYVKFEPTDSVGQASNISFDAVTLEVWGALLHGSRLVGIRREDTLQPLRLRQQLIDNRIDVFFLPAALMKQLVAESPGIFGSLKYFMSGGEQADYHTHRRILDNGAPRHLINPYGPTETTVFSVIYETNGMTEADRYVPIGYPISNTTCYVLDQYLQPVPPRVAGELFGGGPGVARGYLSRPDLTAEKFVPDPFGDEPGARLYASGDLGRYRSDGLLEFLGREDRQVKLRGFRVEPPEIEGALLESGRVREVSVQVDKDRLGTEMLVAYVVPADPALDLEELREFLRDRVPRYMLPSLFVPLAALPLNANGKLDVAALREALPTARSEADVVEPRTVTEGRLDTIWRDLLDLDMLGVLDDFFALGGTSLKAARLVTRARTVFRCDIPLRLAFEQPTIASFAEAVDRLRAAQAAAAAPAAAAVPPAPPAPAAVPPAPPAPAPVAAAPPPAAAAPPAPTPPPPPAEPARASAPAAGSAGPTDTADRLAAIWKEILEVDELSPDDNFFTVGGHSLNANRAISRAQAVFGREIPLRLLFQNPTLGAFAAAIDRLEATADAGDQLRAAPTATLGQHSVEGLLEAVEELSDEDVRRLIGPGS